MTIFCPECGGANPDTAKFCVKCGTAIVPPPASTPRPVGPARHTPVMLPPTEAASKSGGVANTGCGCALLLAVIVLLAEDIWGGGIGWFWRIIMVALFVLACRVVYSRSGS